MDKVVFKRGNKSFLDNIPVVNGQLLYNTETGETFMDSNGVRVPTGGGSGGVADSMLSGSSTNPVQNKVVKEALDSKLSFSSNGNIGDFAVSNGAGGITWRTITIWDGGGNY